MLYHASLSAGFTLNYCGTLFPHPVGYILTEHYGNIVVVDPRYAGDLNVCEKFSEYQFDDILFLVNSSMGNTGAWNRYFAGLID